MTGRSVVNKAQNAVNTLKIVIALNEISDILKMTLAWLPCYIATSIVAPHRTMHFYLDAGHVVNATSKQANWVSSKVSDGHIGELKCTSSLNSPWCHGQEIPLIFC